MTDAISQFRDAIRAAGLEPPEVIEPGKMHRFAGEGKRNSNTAGWCKLFDDGRGGCFGDWSTGLSDSWHESSSKPLSQEEQERRRKQVKMVQEEARAQRDKQYAEAKQKANATWDEASPANDDYPYLARKGINAHGAKLSGNSLLIPIRINGEITSLQYINSEGEKRFLAGGAIKGGSFLIGMIKNAEALCIAEGFATAVSIHEATGLPVVVAFNAGNLESVAIAMKKRHPDLELIICADNDEVGTAKANKACSAVDGRIAIAIGEGNDFNDMANKAILSTIKEAGSAIWPEPESITAVIEPKPYPVKAFPPIVREAIEEVHGFTQAPIAMIGSCALSVLSLAIQGHVNIRRSEGLEGPVSLFVLTIAESGERKSTCDKLFLEAINTYEQEQADINQALTIRYNQEMEVWEAECKGMLDGIRNEAKKNGDNAASIRAKVKELNERLYAKKPEEPIVPRLIWSDATPEALAYGLAKHYPSGGVISSEGGAVLGSHGMSKESAMRNLALQNVLWDGGSQTIDRKTGDSYTLESARLTVAIQAQEAAIKSFIDNTGDLARGTGFFARFLFSRPKSTQGTRYFKDAPTGMPKMGAFNKRLSSILNTKLNTDIKGRLTPKTLDFSTSAKEEWVGVFNAVEKKLCAGGELSDVRDVASKVADNIARVACLLQFFKDPDCSQVEADILSSAAQLVEWYLLESQRFFNELCLTPEQANCVALDDWLINRSKARSDEPITKRLVQQSISPNRLRKKAALEAALNQLVNLNRIRLIEGTKKQVIIKVNPELIL